MRRGLSWTLGLGAFGLAFSITTISVALPPLLRTFTDSNTLIGGVIAAEGVFAVSLSLVVGPWSDSFHTPFGRRRPFMLAALGPLGVSLALVGLMPGLLTTIAVVLAFYIAYYVYEPPYRGLYPDLVPESHYGRAQSVQHVMRGLALGIALIGGNELFKVWRPAPFVAAALVTTLACGAAIAYVDEPRGGGERDVFQGVRAYLSTSWGILRDEPHVRRFLLANSAWEGTFAAARTFVVLYVTKGLHQPRTVVTAVLAAVAVGYLVAAFFAGRLGDRFGLARVIFCASFVYAGGLLAAGLARAWHDAYFALIVPVSMAAGIVMTLSWALLFRLMPAGRRGAISGLALGTKGVGLLFALVTGAAIDQIAPQLPATGGYQALWPICALPILAAIPLVGSLLSVDPRASIDKPEPQPG